MIANNKIVKKFHEKTKKFFENLVETIFITNLITNFETK